MGTIGTQLNQLRREGAETEKQIRTQDLAMQVQLPIFYQLSYHTNWELSRFYVES